MLLGIFVGNSIDSFSNQFIVLVEEMAIRIEELDLVDL